jgi:restriction system protein
MSDDRPEMTRTVLVPESITLTVVSDEPPIPQIPLSLSAIVETIAAVPDGNIVRLLAPAWAEIAKVLKHDATALSSLSSRQWEELVAAAYDRAGYDEVILTPRSGDLGRDVIAIKTGWGSIRIIDQVKAYKPGHKVTANDVRALLGVLQADQKATKGIVTTTSDFAPGIASDPFISPFVPYRLELIDGVHLIDRLRSLSENAL